MAKDSPEGLRQAFFKRRFVYLLASILLLLVLSPLLDQYVGLRELMNIFFTVILLSAVFAVSRKKHHTIIASTLALLMLSGLWSDYFLEIHTMNLLSLFGGAAFFLFTIFHTLSFIYMDKEVEIDTIAAAAVVYLMMALMWAFLYAALELIRPGSFSIPETAVGEERLGFLYYSFVTITTLGYGDFTPLSGFARSISVLEAVVGQLYLVVQVAWLVGMHVSQSMTRSTH